jgi:methylglutaconyl-CoA hydratase
MVIQSDLQSDQGSVRTLTLNDPARRNPLSKQMTEALLEALQQAEQDPGVRLVVLSGAGGAFSAGVDLGFLKNVTQLSAEENRAHSEQLLKLFKRVYTFPKPTLAALTGPAVAGGAGLATACDLIVMGEEARIGYTEAKIGFVAGLVSVILLRTVGEKHAKELLLTGRLVSAAEALRMGLVNEVVPTDQVLPRTYALAEEIVRNSPTSLSLTKELIYTLPGMGLDDGMRLAAVANAWVRQTGDLLEGIDAFFGKREPKFNG